ncbi:hypothetical protein A2U01_0041382, partial [Trifolium medium]|nr:hypothetical protein [Trifolium medium]
MIPMVRFETVTVVIGFRYGASRWRRYLQVTSALQRLRGDGYNRLCQLATVVIRSNNDRRDESNGPMSV